jgi:hypothetical protein
VTQQLQMLMRGLSYVQPNQGVRLPAASRLQVTPSVLRTNDHDDEPS